MHLAVVIRNTFHFVGNTGRFAALGADKHYVAGVNGHFLMDDSAGLHLVAGLLVFGHHINTFHSHPVQLRECSGYFTLLSLVFSGNDDDGIIGFYMHYRSASLQYFGSQRDDLHEILLAQLTGHRPENTGPAGHFLIIDNDGGIVIRSAGRPFEDEDDNLYAHLYFIVQNNSGSDISITDSYEDAFALNTLMTDYLMYSVRLNDGEIGLVDLEINLDELETNGLSDLSSVTSADMRFTLDFGEDEKDIDIHAEYK